MATKYRWNAEPTVCHRLDDILFTAATTKDSVDESWKSKALAATAELSPNRLRELSIKQIDSIPYADVIELLDGPEDSEQVRRIRKFFMVARDGIILSHSQNPGPQFDSLFSLCRNLGLMADSECAEKYVKQAKRALWGVPRTHSSPYPCTTQSELNERLNDCAQSADAMDLYLNNSSDISCDQYHDARKRFRRLTHTVLLLAAGSDCPELADLAVNGIAMNRMYGDVKDAIMLS